MDIEKDDTPGNREDLMRRCEHLSVSVAWVNLELYKQFRPDHKEWAEKQQKNIVREHFNGIIRGAIKNG